MLRIAPLIIVLAIASCQQPSEFELTNPFDPESPELKFQSPTGFVSNVAPNNLFGFSWNPGKFAGSRAQIKYICGADTTLILDEVMKSSQHFFNGVHINAIPFHFEFRTLVGDTASPWLKTPLYRYELAPITNLSVSGREYGIDISWAQAQVAEFTVYTSGAERRIRVPVKHSELYRSVDGGLFELIDTAPTQSYKHEFEPELGVRYRYLIRSFADTLQLESSVSTALRLDEQLQTIVRFPSQLIEFRSMNPSTGLMLFANVSHNTLSGFNLNTMQYQFSVTLNQAVDFAPYLTYASVVTAEGLDSEIFVAYRYRIHSYNRSNAAKRVIANLEPKYVIEAIYHDPQTRKLVVRAFFFDNTNPDQSEMYRAVFVLDLQSDQVVNIYGDMLAHELFFEEISTFDSSVIIHFPLRSKMEITSLDNLNVEPYASSGNYWMGPIIRSPDNNEPAVVMVHNFEGFVVQQKSIRSARKHPEFGKVMALRYDETNQLLYLDYAPGITRIIDIQDDYRLINTINSRLVHFDTFFWKGRNLRIDGAPPLLREIVINRIWLSGN